MKYELLNEWHIKQASITNKLIIDTDNYKNILQKAIKQFHEASQYKRRSPKDSELISIKA